MYPKEKQFYQQQKLTQLSCAYKCFIFDGLQEQNDTQVIILKRQVFISRKQPKTNFLTPTVLLFVTYRICEFTLKVFLNKTPFGRKELPCCLNVNDEISMQLNSSNLQSWKMIFSSTYKHFSSTTFPPPPLWMKLDDIWNSPQYSYHNSRLFTSLFEWNSNTKKKLQYSIIFVQKIDLKTS